MKIKIIACVVAAVLFVSAVIFVPNWGGDGEERDLQASEHVFGADSVLANAPVIQLSHLSVDEALEGQTARDGYILAPTMFGLAGIDTLSTFVLRTPSDYTANPPISIDGQEPPHIERVDSDTFLITPAIPLSSNSVYIFRLAVTDGDDITWAFQTAARFEITSTLPRNESVNVPVRTGIEITFSYGGEIDISGHFSIYPQVDGDFINRDSTAIFVPSSSLAHGTIYTVTISAGIGLPGTSEMIAPDRVFSFETEPAPGSTARLDYSSSIHFSGNYVEFPSFSAPNIYYWLNYNRDRTRPAIEMSVYRLDDRETAIETVKRFEGVPRWSFYSNSERHLVDVSDLPLVFSETVTQRTVDEYYYWNEVYTFPETLPPGFYLLNAVTSGTGQQGQVVIQITDLAVQVIADNEKTIVWANDMHTGMPAGATVYDPVSDRVYESNEQGIAVFERAFTFGEHLIINGSGIESVVFAQPNGMQNFYSYYYYGDYDYVEYEMSVSPRGFWWGGSQNANNLYWSALQLDRTLFQRNDTLSLWGFVQNRQQEENITHVTAVLTQNNWRYWDEDGRDPLYRQNIPVSRGAYSDEITLPHIDPGSYELAIYHGDILLDSIYFSVMDFVKPPYQLTVSSDVAAIFAGERVTFTARTEFFEGTPVPDLNISYNTYGNGLRASNRGNADTDIDGVVQVTERPTPSDSAVQGQRTLQFWAEASLPEIGWTYEGASVRVFINDINVRPRASRDGRDATLSVDVNDITLDRLNNGTAAHWGDFLADPKANQQLSVEIVEHWWERIPDGDYYDHVTRQTATRYRYEHRENILERFEMTTDAEGFATRDFTVPDNERRSYEARITTTDGNGRTIIHNVYIGRDYSSFYQNANNDRLFLDGASAAGYDIGDDIELTVMRGDETLTQGNFLFVVVQGDVLSYHVGTNPLNITFGEQHVPNAQVFAYHFNGHTYNTGGQMAQRLRYNPVNRELIINITANQDAYTPGQTPTFTITTTDADGNPKPANVNISLVDEALFALVDYNVDTLETLYRNIDDNLRLSIATHRTFISAGIDELSRNGMVNEDDSYGLFGAAPQAEMEMAGSADADSGGGGGDTRIRERFEDTAVFASIRTNANGTATFSFPLPDNITSWRVTASAISDDLYAGNTVQNVRVTLPVFVHYTLNRTFLTGDIPTIGVNVYGTSLSGGERAQFRVYREDFPDDVRTATGAAFERVNIPLWEMAEEGFGAIIIHAEISETNSAFRDAVRHEYQVVNSHRSVDTAVFYDVTPSTAFDVNTTGLTNITFTDRGRGQFLRDLYGLRYTWWSGARVEGLVARREANALITAHFPDVRLYGDTGTFNMLDYQTDAGGISILPYAEAELEVTVALLPFILEDVNTVSLRDYLKTVYETSATDNKMLALYGLAMLGEPVLLELQRYARLENLSVRNTAYVALGFAALGDTQTARDLYDERIAPHIQRIEPLYRVNAGSSIGQIVDATSVTALLAARIGMPESIGLHQYAVQNRAETRNDSMLINIERLTFISYEINNYTSTPASITYTLFGETFTRNLGHGGQYTLRIPAQRFNEFNLTSVTGEVGAVSVIRTQLDDISNVENAVTIRREYFRGDSNVRATTFSQDEIIRVQITVEYAATDLEGTYVITDFLPAGLAYVSNSARIPQNDSRNHSSWRVFASTEGQRVTFYDYNSRRERNHTYHYYARVINPGTFRAEGTLVQNLGAREFMVAGDDVILTID